MLRRGIALLNCWDEVVAEAGPKVEAGSVAPIATGGGVIHVGGPRIDDALPLHIDARPYLGVRESGPHLGLDLRGAGGEYTDVVNDTREPIARRGHKAQDRLHGVGHRHERDARVGPNEAIV